MKLEFNKQLYVGHKKKQQGINYALGQQLPQATGLVYVGGG